MHHAPRRLRLSSPPRRLGGWVVCGVLAGAGAWVLAPGVAQAQDTASVSASAEREARLAYEAGLLLHREGSFEAAAEQFVQAIGQDPSMGRAYAALTDAQVMASRDRVLRALRAADEGDLANAQRHAQKAVEMDGENPQAVAIAQSFADPSALLTAAQRTAFEQATRLTDDQQWRLARQQFAALVEQVPLFLPGRAALHRATHFEGRAVEMANRGIALMQQRRLGPAVEQLAGAVAVWPYHPDAAASLEQAQTMQRNAEATAQRATAAFAAADYEHALQLAEEARAQDRSNATARGIVRDAQRGLADLAVQQGATQLAEGDFAAAKQAYAEALEHIGGFPDARRGMARAYDAQAQQLADEGRPGAALLAYQAGRVHDRAGMSRAAERVGRRILADTGATFSLHVPAHDPALGVSSDTLHAELAGRRLPSHLARADDLGARYSVEVRINQTDVELRRIRNAGSSYLHSNGLASGYTRWEKRGTVACTITITDRETDATVRRWNADRWVTFSDSQQYVVGSTWRRSYWTLPSDDEVASRLADDLADVVWPEVRAAVTMARARALRDAAEELADDGDAAGSLELRVAATLLAGQENPREGEHALRELARAFDAEHTPEPGDTE